jgi:Flp pilus assembly protein TadB
MGQRSSRWLWVVAALVVLALAVVGWAVAPATTMIVGVVLAATAALSRR